MRRALSAALQRLSRAVAPPHPAESHPAFYAALRRLGTPTARDLRTLAIHEAGHALLRIPRDGGHDSMLMADSVPA